MSKINPEDIEELIKNKGFENSWNKGASKETSTEPSQTSTEPSKTSLDNPQSVITKDFSQKYVLIVDDDPDITTLIERLLKPICQVQIEHEPQAALRSVMFKQPDLILLDIHMPDINGIEALKQFNSFFKEKGISTKVIMLTSNNYLDTVEDAIIHGADGYLLKPIDHTDFLKRIEEQFNSL